MRFISSELTRKFGKAVLKTKKNSPHIFFAAGVAGIVGGAVLACRATLTLDKEVDDFKNEVHGIKDLAASKAKLETYTDADYARDLMYVYAKGAYRIGKLYIVPVAVGGVGIALVTGSHIQLSKRNTALTSAFVGLAKSFDEYRARVREELGEEKELEIHRSIQTEKVAGSKELVKVTSPNGWSDYMRIFDPSNVNYEPNNEFNRLFIECQQRYLNNKLQSRGYVFLNEAYEHLGFPPTKAGQIVGWVWKNKSGDGYIDFGLFEAHAHNFVIGKELSVCLDFNVDGVILELIDEEEI